MKKLLIAVATSALTILLVGTVVGSATGSLGGVSNRYKNGCAPCHGVQGSLDKIGLANGLAGLPAAPTGEVVINGPAALKAGEKGTYQVVLLAMVPGPVGGFDAAVEDQYGSKAGTMTAGQNSKIRPSSGNQEVGHTPDLGGKAINGRVWTFDWTAPSTPGAYNLYVSALAANGNGGPDALDFWYTKQLAIAVQ